MSESRRIGEAKSVQEIFKESNSELIGNLMKGIHLDGGGKMTFYNNQASKIVHAIQTAVRSGGLNTVEATTSAIAKMLYEFDYNRLTAVRSSMLKRSVLLKLRFNSNGKNINIAEYEAELKLAIEETKNHSKKLLEGIK